MAPPNKTPASEPACTSPTVTCEGHGPRLRVSVCHFNSTLVTGMKGSTYTFDDTILKGLVDARVDDYTMIANVGFDTTHPLQPKWIGSPGAKPEDPAASIAFLKQAVDAMHSRSIQFCAGFVMVKPSKSSGKPVPDPGPPFARILAGYDKQPDQITQLAKNLVDMFRNNGIKIDGLNFDFENGSVDDDKFPGVNNGMRMFLSAVASEMKSFTNGWIAYDGSPFFGRDGGDAGTLAFMKSQPYSIAGTASNIIARPQCYEATVSISASQIKQGVKCALAPTGGAPAGSGPARQGDDAVTVGGGIPSSGLQMFVWGGKLPDADKAHTTLETLCKTVLRPAKVGLCVYPGGQLTSTLFARVKTWEAALNPGTDAPGKVGQPLQVPRPSP